MKRHFNTLVIILTLGFIACGEKPDNKPAQEPTFDCNVLTDKKTILEIATSIIEKPDNENVWNLSEIDTTAFFTTEDYFTNAQTKNRIVLVGGYAGASAGTANNLLMLFSCSDTFEVLWAGQVGDFEAADILDVNGDGIKEIVFQASTMWMGECSDDYTIFNFKDDTKNILFSARSYSFIDCGRDNLGEFFREGDTLEYTIGCSLVKNRYKSSSVQQVRTAKIHNGGQTDEEILANVKILTDTNTTTIQ